MVARVNHIEDADAIRMVFQRLCREGHSLHVKSGLFEQDFPIHLESEDRIVVGIPSIIRGQWSLKPGMRVQLTLSDRGRQYEAIAEFAGFGDLDGVECSHLSQPRILKCMDDSSLSDYVPDQPLRCTYTTRTLDIKDGRLRSLGLQGVELCREIHSGPGKEEALRLGTETMLEIFLDKETKIIAPGRISHFGDGFAGIRFREDGDQSFLSTYRPWLNEMVRGQRLRDQESFDPKGTRAQRVVDAEEDRPGISVKILVEREPMVLVICEGDAFAQHFAKSLGRKFGVACLDYIQGDIQPTLKPLGATTEDWGKTKLLLIHQRLRVTSGLELTRRLVQDEHCQLPILVAGIEEDVALKRNRAIAAGAVDFISVDPFNVLKVMKAIEDTLKMFG